ncbi:MAG: hypothetical protein QN193_03670 [Armatimonadota bacterium]|nr:hypothetical protein [Armatimonadota bacterium]MDR7444322.1 hypothetical protein [Armatimonadota bacterium]MDR7569687.1 hypothetical protein [Armatimonadota bacterium]MDR7614809.1 hypothetical protein [Armatimonadota bacterium]
MTTKVDAWKALLLSVALAGTITGMGWLADSEFPPHRPAPPALGAPPDPSAVELRELPPIPSVRRPVASTRSSR